MKICLLKAPPLFSDGFFYYAPCMVNNLTVKVRLLPEITLLTKGEFALYTIKQVY